MPRPDRDAAVQACIRRTVLTRRRRARRPVIWSAQVAELGRTPMGCVVLDVSAGGAKLLVEHRWRTGQILTLVSPHFPELRARIVWTAARRVGLEFIDSGEQAMKRLCPSSLVAMEGSAAPVGWRKWRRRHRWRGSSVHGLVRGLIVNMVRGRAL